MTGGKLYLSSARPRPKRRKTKRLVTKSWGANPIGKTTTNIVQRSSLNTGFPQNYNCKLRYVDRATYQATSGGKQQYRLNGLQDPDYTHTLTGHQPLYFDQFAVVYNEYLCTGCKVTITLAQTNDSDNPAIVCWSVRDNPTINSTSVSHAIEEGNRTVINLGYAGGGSPIKSMSQFVNIGRVHGTKKITPSNDSFVSLVTTTPRDEVIGTLQFFSSDEVLSVSMDYTVTIDYYVQFFNKRDIAQS